MEQPRVDGTDWPKQVTDRVVDVIDQVRTKTTDQAITAARGIVFGTVVAVLGLLIVVLALVGAFRMLDGYLPFETWAAYLLLGAILTLVGLLLWTRRRPRTD
jgi:uncharacterized protein YacL